MTIAAEQKRFIDARVRERGLEHLVEIRLQDYREIPEVNAGRPFDAVASIEMGEHVGEQNYGTYAQVLHDAVKPGGRVLIQQMSRSGGRDGHPGGGPFIESFIAPDMHMRPVGETVRYLERGGLEVRDVHALREHYVRTVAGWMENFEANLDRLTELVGEEVVRVWRLYLVGGAMAFRDGRMGVDQILMVRPGGSHTLPRREDIVVDTARFLGRLPDQTSRLRRRADDLTRVYVARGAPAASPWWTSRGAWASSRRAGLRPAGRGARDAHEDAGAVLGAARPGRLWGADWPGTSAAASARRRGGPALRGADGATAPFGFVGAQVLR